MRTRPSCTFLPPPLNLGVAAHGFVTHARALPTSEWLVNQHRDSYASYMGHHNMLLFLSVAENESVGRMRFNMLEVCARAIPTAILTVRGG
jgi:peptidoglycan/LPS O-acetylase OafA/YrhL